MISQHASTIWSAVLKSLGALDLAIEKKVHGGEHQTTSNSPAFQVFGGSMSLTSATILGPNFLSMSTVMHSHPWASKYFETLFEPQHNSSSRGIVFIHCVSLSASPDLASRKCGTYPISCGLWLHKIGAKKRLSSQTHWEMLTKTFLMRYTTLPKMYI